MRLREGQAMAMTTLPLRVCLNLCDYLGLDVFS
jgi:hypothetical protein